MRTSISRIKYLAGLLLIVGLFACEGPPGTPGADGQDGTDGINGTDGADGADGADGNANVTIVSLMYGDITWTAGTYLGRTANTYSLTESAVNQDIIDHGTVLGYCFLNPNWYPLPFIWENSAGTSRQYTLHGYSLNTITLFSYQTSGVLSPNAISEFRFLIITDNTITKSASSGQEILDKLERAGVDVNDYYEVMDYFELDY
jgi:hypothetical protein